MNMIHALFNVTLANGDTNVLACTVWAVLSLLALYGAGEYITTRKGE